MISLLFYLLVIGLALMISAFFSASETALMAFREHRVSKSCTTDQIQSIKRLLKQPDRLLSVILFGNTFSNIFASSMVTMIASQYGGKISMLLASFLLTFCVLVFAEVLPKTIAAFYPESISMVCAPILKYILSISYPLTDGVNGISKLVISGLGLHRRVNNKNDSIRDEIRSLINQNIQKIDGDQRLMLLSLLDLTDLNVNDVMVPKKQITGLDLKLPWTSFLESLMSSKRSLTLVYQQDLDHIIGVVNWQKLSVALLKKDFDKQGVKGICDPVGYIPEGVALSKQLFRLKGGPRKIHIVVNEFGGMVGMIRPEDLIEEIIGEYLPYASSANSLITKLPSGMLRIKGEINVRDLERILKFDLGLSGDSTTLSGALIEHLEMVPIGSYSIKKGSYSIEVEVFKENKIESVLLRRYGNKSEI